MTRTRSAGAHRSGNRRFEPVGLGLLLVVCVGLVSAGWVATLSAASSASGSRQPPPARNTAYGVVANDAPALQNPFVLTGRNRGYLYGSVQVPASGAASGPTSARAGIVVRSFTKLGRWGPARTAMPVPPSWTASAAAVGDPDVHLVGHRYVLWFSAPWSTQTLADGDHPLCLGVATASDPLGPFVSSGSTPAICQVTDGGSTEPRMFIDPSGREWLDWRSGSTSAPLVDPPLASADLPAGTTRIWAQALDDGGTAPNGSPRQILTPGQLWEQGIVGSPDMVAASGRTYLFFTGARTTMPATAVGFARCRGAMGPCRSAGLGPFFGGNFQGLGPNSESVFSWHGQTRMMYLPHALTADDPVPHVAYARIGFSGSGPYAAQS